MADASIHLLSELDGWQAHFERLGVEHTPVVERSYGTLRTAVLTFKDPDRIQFEMFWMEELSPS